MISVTDPRDGSRWLTLEGHYSWEQPVPPEEDRFEIPRREVWYQLKGYIVRKEDADVIFQWALQQNFMGRWMPESHALHRVFLGEFYWSPAFEYHNRPYFDHEAWTRGWDQRIPNAILVATDGYLGESTTYDCSVDESIHITMPAKWLADGMGLRWNGVEGQYCGADGEIVAYDPSVHSTGPGVLLINFDKLQTHLASVNCEVIWTLLGEKGVLGNRFNVGEPTGRLEISGAFRIRSGELEGRMNSRFVSAAS